MSEEVKNIEVEPSMNTPVFIAGESGTGKSTAIETLPPNRTYIINTELKSLPFDNYFDFKIYLADTYKKIMKIIDVLDTPAGQKGYDYVVLDSFTSTSEIFQIYCEAVYTNYEQWKMYNAFLSSLMSKMKKLKQQVFFLGITEQKDATMGEPKSYIKVRGKELKYGGIEKEFAVVLFTQPIYDEETTEMTDVLLRFKSNSRTSAKSPRGMFDNGMKNDLVVVANKIKDFYERRRKAETANSST